MILALVWVFKNCTLMFPAERGRGLRDVLGLRFLLHSLLYHGLRLHPDLLCRKVAPHSSSCSPFFSLSYLFFLLFFILLLQQFPSICWQYILCFLCRDVLLAQLGAVCVFCWHISRPYGLAPPIGICARCILFPWIFIVKVILMRSNNMPILIMQLLE